MHPNNTTFQGEELTEVDAMDTLFTVDEGEKESKADGPAWVDEVLCMSWLFLSAWLPFLSAWLPFHAETCTLKDDEDEEEAVDIADKV